MSDDIVWPVQECTEGNTDSVSPQHKRTAKTWQQRSKSSLSPATQIAMLKHNIIWEEHKIQLSLERIEHMKQELKQFEEGWDY